MLDMLICILLYEVYCFLCLKGELTIKIILPFVTSLTYTIISYGFLYLTSLITGLSLEQLGLQSSLFRYFCVGLVNLTMITVLLIIWRTKAKVYSLKKVSNIIALMFNVRNYSIHIRRHVYALPIYDGAVLRALITLSDS